MPEYLAPGVYIEEKSFRSKSIEGVSTTTTGFIGPARFGPTDAEPDIITSLAEFERVYGDGQQLEFEKAGKMPNYLWHAVRAFFDEGGKRLHISRVFKVGTESDGCAWTTVGGSNGLAFRARFPGAAGNLKIMLTIQAGQNLLGAVRDPLDPANTNTKPKLGALSDNDVVWIWSKSVTSPPEVPVHSGFYLAKKGDTSDDWSFSMPSSPPTSPPQPVRLQNLNADATPSAGDVVRLVTISMTVLSDDGTKVIGTWNRLPLDPNHITGGAADSLYDIFAAKLATGSDAKGVPVVVALKLADGTGLDALQLLQNNVLGLGLNLADLAKADAKLVKGLSGPIALEKGNDGERPGAPEYEGTDDPTTSVKTGLKQFEDVEDISIVAAPGSTWNYSVYRDEANSIFRSLITHASKMKYRIAVLDSAQMQSISDVRKMRAKLDSTYAALYYPWVKVFDPITRSQISLPPSGFVSGIYARNDINRGVYKAPANEVVNLALGFEYTLNKSQQEVLNPEGINCFRFFEGRGMLLWGARTISSDSEWKYVNLRRYFAFLEHSIDKGTQWAVFEPNGERLWANVRSTVADFLLNEWQKGALLGDKPELAYFVKCDRSTMTQNDLDNGRLVCLIGVAALRPAEFVIFRIGQWTADRKV